jgi:GNAT superfamily N-acetyltransferase
VVVNSETSFRPYSSADGEACLALFDANCPTFFAPNERDDYVAFLDVAPEAYEVCEVGGRVVAAFGLLSDETGNHTLTWIMLDPDSQGRGIGTLIMKRVTALASTSQSRLINIAASHLSAPFFARFGATATLRTDDGWGPGMHRVDMELVL